MFSASSSCDKYWRKSSAKSDSLVNKDFMPVEKGGKRLLVHKKLLDLHRNTDL